MQIPGPSTLVQGDLTAGYYGKVTGIITGTDLFTKTGVTEGTALITTDIPWLKFSHNNRVLFIADRNIKKYAGWGIINSHDCVRGKVIDINGIKYLCRLMRGAHTNPVSFANGDNPGDYNIIGPNSEWYNTIVKFTPNNADSNWSGIWTMCQEINAASSISSIMLCGDLSVRFIATTGTSDNGDVVGWRPVLEVL